MAWALVQSTCEVIATCRARGAMARLCWEKRVSQFGPKARNDIHDFYEITNPHQLLNQPLSCKLVSAHSTPRSLESYNHIHAS